MDLHGKSPGVIVPAFVLSILVSSGIRSSEFEPGPDGWIRHWIIYGPIGTFDSALFNSDQVHPFTGVPFVLIDEIAEDEGKEGRRTELDFLPAPGKYIDTAFGTLYPTQVLRRETKGINPNGKLLGIGWVDCDCSLNSYDVYSLDPNQNFRNFIIYAYAYVENTTGKPLDVFISFAVSQYVHVLLGPVPDEEGTDFMKSIFVRNDGGTTDCVDDNGPSPDSYVVIRDTVILEPGLNLLLAKVVSYNFATTLSFRFRHNDPPEYTPVLGDEIRIRLSPDIDAPDPALFLRMDADRDGSITISDVVATAMALFEGAEPLGCPDAADANDDGKVDLSDPIGTLRYLFLGGDPPPFPRGCCGLDPTEDDLADCAPAERGC